MIGFYSSYLEFLGAVYFSMSLDEILKKKVWSPQDAKKQNRVLESLDGHKDKNFTKAVVDANQTKGAILQAELTKKSVIGLFMISFLLIICGIESHIDNINNCFNQLLNLHLCIAYTMSYFIISLFCLQWVVFNNWKYTTLYICSIFMVFLLLIMFNITYGKTKLELFIVTHIGIFVCTIMTMPILWQIYISWLYKNVFYCFIKDKIAEAKDKYDEVIYNLREHNYNKLPKNYYSIYMKNSHRDPNTTTKQVQDDSLTEYEGELYNDIRTIGNRIKLYYLIVYLIKNKIKTLFNWLKKPCKEKFILQSRLNTKKYSYYANKYNACKKRNNNLRMKNFCNNEGINFEEFHKYYNSYNKRNK